MTPKTASMAGPPSGANRINVASLITGFALGAVVATFAWVQVIPDEGSDDAASGLSDFVLVDGPVGETVDDGATAVAGGPQTRTIRRGGGSGTEGDAQGGVSEDGAGPGGPGDGPGGAGAGAGGGTTTGVEATKIKLGATYVAGGLACDFLCEVRDAMEAVRGRVNRSSDKIHGRTLDISYKNDDWDPQRGKTFIGNLIEEGVFAFAVSPSSEGLNAASEAGAFRNNKVPVVGADGLNNTQFTDPWIWPVATATTTNVHIIMQDAWNRGKRNPAIVFGNTYRFGVEGAYAFNQAYQRRSGKNIPGFGANETGCKAGSRYCGIPGDANQYTTQTGAVEDACNTAPKCDFILLLLEPKTAQNWMADFTNPAGTGGQGLAGAQPLFTTSFGDNCKAKCQGMVVWTGYNPPTDEFENRPEVGRYTQELTAQKGSADIHNQFSMGGYVGMELLVQALKQAGKDLTREKLVAALNSTSLKTGLTAAPELRWSESQRYANHSAHGFEMKWEANAGRFGGFYRTTDYIRDPWLGQDNQT